MINPACSSSRYHSSSVPYQPARITLKEEKQSCVCAVRLPVLCALPWGVFEVSSERIVMYSTELSHRFFIQKDNLRSLRRTLYLGKGYLALGCTVDGWV